MESKGVDLTTSEMHMATNTRLISSFAAPTEEDMRIFDAMSADDRKALVLAEIDKGFKSKTEPFTAETLRGIMKSALERVPANVPNRTGDTSAD